MQQPLISIIITILNGEKTLSECLASITNQSFSNYELVVVDGGSKDRTIDIVNASAIPNKTIRILPGVGLYEGLNAAIRLSTGKWFYFIGADDELHSHDTLQKVADHIRLKKSGSRVIVGNVKFVKQGQVFRPTFGSPPYWMRHEMHHQGMFYDRSLFDKVMYTESMKIASDYEFNLKLVLNGVQHEYMNLIVCNFGGDGVSEKQLKLRYSEMNQIYRLHFKGIGLYQVIAYFWLRRNAGMILRRYNLLALRKRLKGMFG